MKLTFKKLQTFAEKAKYQLALAAIIIPNAAYLRAAENTDIIASGVASGVTIAQGVVSLFSALLLCGGLWSCFELWSDLRKPGQSQGASKLNLLAGALFGLISGGGLLYAIFVGDFLGGSGPKDYTQGKLQTS